MSEESRGPMPNKPGGPRPDEPTLFISHKTADKEIADVLREFIDEASRNEVTVFQSSSGRAQSPEAGERLVNELQDELWRSHVVILIYTTAEDQDWSWCTWECGVATRPETPPRRIIVLQCGIDYPQVLAGQVRVNARNREDIFKFVRSLLTDPNFFPGCNKALASKLPPTGKHVLDLAEALFTRLAGVLPKFEVAEWSAQPMFRLQLPEDAVTRLAQPSSPPDQDCMGALVSAIDHQAQQVFGIAGISENTTFADLVQCWSQKHPDLSQDWVQEVCTQVARAAARDIPPLRWVYLQEPNGNARYAPVLSRVRKVPALKAVQFDINLLPYDNLTATPVVTRMIPRDSIYSMNLDKEPANSARLGSIEDRLDSSGYPRLPVLSSDGRLRLMVHRSMIDKYLAQKALHPSPSRPITELTLADLLADNEDLKQMFETGFDFVSCEARLVDVKAKMAARKECQDVFVTRTGGRDEPVLGWITNVMIAEA